ncbi:Nif3-like dinuclear metal center hexameric protein [Aliidiomarina quisquiliarum]|uniref:Nif3-like dinuclear metal center hexameric protein n=1 Tax=Aliidiomarina quisquiliarum TaxID=2938947 RepID=UPI00208E2B32|nr:Nif3-like dinuclear metal center hexameric protein [Aliidiomarina quisquiliarum]MCO4320876.1 Nif3-like dinuclear metal center hexameric protein [Aliidiomarina quisquiliarum]
MHRDQLMLQLNSWLEPAAVQDYCPNGLQVEGSATIAKVVTGVTASQALIDQAIAVGADTLLVHHGYFWKGEHEPITGMKRRRIKALLAANINLVAYHLPLDVHPEFGNNVELIKLINGGNSQQPIYPVESVAPRGVLMLSQLNEPCTGNELAARLETLLARPLTASVQNATTIQRIAVCTGGGQGFIEAALTAGADAFITGEVSEQTIHVARECGIQFFAAGHHATERYGIKALGNKLAAECGLDVQFIDIDNPA